jgi:catechol 2,3-dioxygenase-like lactoylglutathione lyase family enzyme
MKLSIGRNWFIEYYDCIRIFMNQSLGLISLVVKDYDEALNFFVGKLGFELVEDTYIPEQDKRWVVVRPSGNGGSNLLLAKASNQDQALHIGNQTGGRVFLFLYTDNFWRDYNAFKAKGIEFIREPKQVDYGTVAVFKDLYGNQWDLLEPSKENKSWKNRQPVSRNIK